MRFSNDFFQMSRRREQAGSTELNVARIAPPSLQRPASGESQKAFETRRSQFTSLFKERGETLEALAKITSLIPPLYAPITAEYGVVELHQTLPYTFETEELSDEAVHMIARSLGAGLSKIHEAGHWHLGIHPSSLAFEQNQARLFGIGADMRMLSVEGDLPADLGDPAFYPPEMFDKSMKSQIGSWSDVYQASATLFALSVGEAPPSFVERIQDAKGTLNLIKAKLATNDALEQSGLAAAIISGLRLSRRQRPQDSAAWLSAVDFSDFPELADDVSAEGQADEEGDVEATEADAVSSEPVDNEVTELENDHEDEEYDDQPYEPPEKSRAVPLLALALFAGAGGAVAYSMDWFSDTESQFEPEDAYVETRAMGEEEPEPEPTEEVSPVAWIVGDWVIDKAKKGCSQRLTITESDNENELLFTNPGANITDAEEFTKVGNETLRTSEWQYIRDGVAINMVSVKDNSLTLRLSRC